MPNASSSNRPDSRAKVLIIDDEAYARAGFAEFLRLAGFDVTEAATMAAARRAFRRVQPDIVLLDYLLAEGTALDLLPDLRQANPETPVLVVTGHATIDRAVAAIKLGAEQFLTKPIELDAMLLMIERTLDHQRNRRQAIASASTRRTSAHDPFVGESRAIRALAEEAALVAEVDSPVLILGETGSGKGVLAGWLHEVGHRASEPFVDINCAGFSNDLLETELFGHERGAFTGAVSDKQGLIEVAHKGTLFLDEIGDMSLPTQPKLLKAIEDQKFRRIGAVRDRHVDVRIIAATNRDLGAAVIDGQFRADLYYRINMVPLVIPPLRDRPEDIPHLAAAILATVRVRLRKPDVRISAPAEGALAAYDWPGNIRELRNVLERAVLLARNSTLDEKDLRLTSSSQRSKSGPSQPAASTLLDAERRHLDDAIAASGGNVSETARKLGISRSAMYAKLKKHGISPVSSRAIGAEPEVLARNASAGGRSGKP